MYLALNSPHVFPDVGYVTSRSLFLSNLVLIVLFVLYPPPAIGFWSLPITILIFCFAHDSVGFLINRPIIELGKVSFSAYFWHFMVLNFFYYCRDQGLDFFGMDSGDSYVRFSFAMLVILIATFALSKLSFTFIEQPFIAMGRKATISFGK